LTANILTFNWANNILVSYLVDFGLKGVAYNESEGVGEKDR